MVTGYNGSLNSQSSTDAKAINFSSRILSSVGIWKNLLKNTIPEMREIQK